MPRTARPWAPGRILHVSARGFEGANICATDADRRFVVRTAARVFDEEHVRCLGWAILKNHYHMLVQCDSTSPGQVMLRLNTTIAMRARRLRGEHGSVFQGRYFSRLCTDDDAYDQMLAYVLGNPLRHGVLRSLEELERHPWSGLREILGFAPARLVDVPAVLAHFHDDPVLARRSVRELMRAKLERWRIDPPAEPDELVIPRRVTDDESLRRGLRGVVGIVDPVVGDWESRAGRRTLLLRRGWTIEQLIETVCARVGASVTALCEGERSAPVTMARSIVLFIACDYVGVASGEAARAVGVGISTAAGARRRGRAILRTLGCDPEELLGTVLIPPLEMKAVPSIRG